MRFFVCPRCGEPAPASGCAACGRGHEPLLDQLELLDTSLAARHREVDSLKRRLDGSSRELAALEQQHGELLHRLRERSRQLRATAPTPVRSPVPPPPVVASPEPAPVPVMAAGPPPGPVPGPPRPEASARSVQNLLLGIGGTVSAVAVVIFTAVSWNSVGMSGRALILSAITAILLTVPLWFKRRGLVATAETLAALAVLMVGCDVIALYFLDALPGLRGESFPAAAGFTAVAVAAVGAGYRFATGLRAPGWATPVMGLVATGIAWVQDNPAVSAGQFAALTAVSATAAIGFGRFARQNHRADRLLPHATAAIAVVAALGGVTTTAIWLAPAHAGLFAALAAAAMLAVCDRLPQRWRIGALSAAGAAAGFAGMVVLTFSGFAAFVALTDSVPLGAIRGQSWLWQLIPAAIGLSVAAFSVRGLPARPTWLLIGITAAVAAVPATLSMTTVVAAVGLAAVAAAVAAVTAFGVRGWSAPAGASAAVLAAIAVGLSLGDPLTAGVVTVEAAGLALATGAIARQRRRFEAAGAFTGIALWMVTAAVPAWLVWDGAAPQSAVAACLLVAAIAVFGVSLRLWQLPQAGTPARRAARASLAGTAAAAATAAIATITVVALGLATPLLAIPIAALPLGLAATGPKPIAPQRFGARDLGLAAATAAALTALAGAATTAAPGYGLLIYPGLATIAALILAWAPRRLATGLAPGALAVGAASAAVAAVVALPVIPAMLDLAPAVWLAPDWRVPLSLAIAAVLGATGSRPWRWDAAIGAGVLAAATAPAAIGLEWWTTPAMALVLAAGLAPLSVFTAATGSAVYRYVLAAALAGYGLGSALASPLASGPAAHLRWGALAAMTVIAISTTVAITAHRRRAVFGGIAASVAVAALPLATALAGSAANWPTAPRQLSTMAAACAGLLIAALLRAGGSRYLPWVSATVPVATTATALSTLTGQPGALYLATAGLVSVGAAMLHLSDRPQAIIRTVLASPSLLIAAALSGPMAVIAIARPYGWLTAIWTRTPISTVDGLSPGPGPLPGGGWNLAALILTTVAIVLAVLGLAGPRWAVGVAIAAGAVTVPTIPVELDLPWPALPLTSAALAILGYSVISHAALAAAQRICPAILAALLAGSAISGGLADPATTILVLTPICVATTVAAIAGRGTATRATGWALTACGVSGLAAAAGLAAGLAPAMAAFGVLAVAVVLLAIAATQSRLTRGCTWVAECGGYLAVIVALSMAAGSRLHLAIGLVVTGAVLGLLALRAPRSPDRDTLLGTRTWYAVAAVSAPVVAYWLLLAEADISIVELYTVPFALITVLGGWLELRRRPRLRSWIAYGPGLAAGFLPTVAPVLAAPEEPLRRLLLGAAALVVLLLGAWRRLQAPALAGGAVLILLAIHELFLLWSLVPFWAPLAAAGGLLLALGATFEKRRKDLRRLRQSVKTMR